MAPSKVAYLTEDGGGLTIPPYGFIGDVRVDGDDPVLYGLWLTKEQLATLWAAMSLVEDWVSDKASEDFETTKAELSDRLDDTLPGPTGEWEVE